MKNFSFSLNFEEAGGIIFSKKRTAIYDSSLFAFSYMLMQSFFRCTATNAAAPARAATIAPIIMPFFMMITSFRLLTMAISLNTLTLQHIYGTGLFMPYFEMRTTWTFVHPTWKQRGLLCEWGDKSEQWAANPCFLPQPASFLTNPEPMKD